MVAMWSVDPDNIVGMESIEPDAFVSEEAASRQLAQSPPGASDASGFPQRGQDAVAISVQGWFERFFTRRNTKT